MANEELKHSIAVVADGPTCTGFRLAGVQNVFPIEQNAQTAANAQTQIEQLLEKEEIGILVVSERTMDLLDWRLKRRIERTAKPVVIAVPDKGGAMEQKDSLRSMVKKALGFELMK